MGEIAKKIFRFPTKVNTITIILTLIVYTVVLAVVAEAAPPTNDYILEPIAIHGEYQEEVNSWVKVVGHVRQKTINQNQENEEVILVPRYTINTYASGNNGNVTSNYHFHYAALYGDGKLKYFPSNKHTGKTHNYQMLTLQEVGGGFIQAIFGRMSYDIGEERKEISFREDLLTITDREMKGKKFGDVLEVEELFDVEIVVRENIAYDDRYSSTIKFTIQNPTDPYHFDMQTWIVNEDGQVFQHLGVYNFHTSLGRFSSYTNETIFKYVKPVMLYMKAIHIDQEGKITELWYKASIEDLLAANAG
jgi:hypothetical protein